MTDAVPQTISVICCYNDAETFRAMLKSSVEKQSVASEIIGIDNSDGRFTSAASALNYGASAAFGRYLIFAHQDILLSDDLFFENILHHFEALGPCALGLAARSPIDNLVYTNLKHGRAGVYAGKKRVSEPQVVGPLDEVFLAIPKDLFLSYAFDENVCKRWHLYVVDLCLRLHNDRIESYVIPCSAYHQSQGVLDASFYETLDLLAATHGKKHRRIVTTCLNVTTNFPWYQLYRLKIDFKLFRRKWKKRLRELLLTFR